MVPGTGLSASGSSAAPVRAGARKRLAPIARESAGPESDGESPAGSKRVIVAERRDFVRGCLRSWIDSFCPEFEAQVIREIDTRQQAGALGQVTAAILGASAPVLSDTWLRAQIDWLRADSTHVPVAVIGEPSEMHATETLVKKLGVQGYIPTSHSMELAAAALRVIVAGGTYFPRPQDHDPRPRGALVDGTLPAPPEASGAKLTPREQAVLNMLCQGLPNKVIAHRLGMALGTVKIHLHNIITKLNVQNRAEAALPASRLQSGAPAVSPAKSAILLSSAVPVATVKAVKP